MTHDITGTLVIPPGVPAFSAPCGVLVRDITRSDAPDTEPVAASRNQLDYVPGDPPPSFSVTGIPEEVLAAVDSGSMALNLEIHVDLDNSGAFSVGDLATLKAYPVSRATTTAPIAVELTRI